MSARASIGRHGITAGIGVASLAIAALLPIDYLAYSGLIFFILGPAHAVYGHRSGRGRDRLEASLHEPSETPLTEPTSADAPRS